MSDGQTTNWQELLALDRERVWHPYGGLPAAPPAPLPVVSAEGVRLQLADGRELIDGMASWWCAIHGYRHPVLDAAVREQLERMSHVMFGGLTHEPAIRLVERLAQVAPAGLERVFLADSGSVSVEVAIKLALQYQRVRGRPERTRLLALRGAYHGDTFGAMALCDPAGMHRLFTGVVAEHLFAPRPPGGFDAGLDEDWADMVMEIVGTHTDELAAVIVEPVVQGAGGMWVYAPEHIAFLRDLCSENRLLLIFDEIATGFGRTGELFASIHTHVEPDIMCVGKALTGGYMTLAATLCTRAVAEAVSGGEGGGLMHGPTFMANPLACAVALASLELLGIKRKDVAPWRGDIAVWREDTAIWADDTAVWGEDIAIWGDDTPFWREDIAAWRKNAEAEREDLTNGGRSHAGEESAEDAEGWRGDVARIERGLREGLAPARDLPGVIDVRVLGAIGVIQLDRAVDIPASTTAAVKRGVWLRPFRNLIYTMPPYVIGEDDLTQVTEAMIVAAEASLGFV